jgi:hypothetical protein
LKLQVVRFDMVGSQIVAGLFEELPEGIIVAGEHELEELGACVTVGAFSVLG